MTKIVPYKNDYLLVERNELLSQIILWTSVFISVATLIITKADVPFYKEPKISLLNTINCFLAVVYFISDIVANYLFQMAETKRREDFFDNSLNTKLSEAISEGYFSNEHLSPSILKMGVNNFENSYFSKNITRRMLQPMLLKTALILVLFLILALFTDREILTTALQIVFPFTIVQQTIRLLLYHKRIGDVFKNYQKIFSSTAEGNKEKLIIHNMTSYETTLSWACIKLNSKIFNKVNDELTPKWEAIKKNYHI